MRSRGPLIVLVLAAAVFAAWQLQLGVHTDEAKYLLNIPYPHPPLARTVLGWTDGWSLQEAFWRVVFAAAMAFACMLLPVAGHDRWGTVLLWLTVPAVLLQAGTVMMAPLVALQALVLLHMLRRQDIMPDAGVIGLLWTAVLMISYQGVLLGPLVAALLLRSRDPWPYRLTALVLPLMLLGLYTVSHPLSAASFLLQAGKDTDLPWTVRGSRLAVVWFLGMGISGVPVTVRALWQRRDAAVAATFLLVSAYVLLGSFRYYAIFFTPFLLWAMHGETRRVRIGVAAGGVLTALVMGAFPEKISVRETMQAVSLQASLPVSVVVLSGDFGHEWQYESPAPVRRPTAALPKEPGAVLICRSDCERPPAAQWAMLDVPGVFGAWQRRQTP